MNCKVAQDLLALYADDVCSEETKKELEEHLKECEKCSKALDEYKNKIDVKTPKNHDIDKIEPLKKAKKKRKKYIIIITVVLILLAVAILEIVWQEKHCEYVTPTSISFYFKTKKQNEMLLNGDIDGFLKNVDFQQTIFTNEGKEISTKKDVEKMLQEYYDNFIKNKHVEVKNIDIGLPPQTIIGLAGGDVEMTSDTNEYMTILYTWIDKKKCDVYFCAEDSDGVSYETLANQKINMILHNNYFKNLKDRLTEFNKGLTHVYYNNDSKSKENVALGKRIDSVNKTSDVLSYKVSKSKYDQKEKVFKGTLTLVVKDKKTNKVAVLQQTVIETSLNYKPLDDAKVVADDGITPELRDQLLKLF